MVSLSVYLLFNSSPQVHFEFCSCFLSLHKGLHLVKLSGDKLTLILQTHGDSVEIGYSVAGPQT